jgi:UDP-2,4-diacetamido-2,4,6-trideoxy-beta-L-altropyranose hydrolase
MRCATLARTLTEQGAEVTFACRRLPGDRVDWLQSQGWPVLALDAMDATGFDGQFDWLVVDHYGLDASWETAMRAVAGRIMVIDDLADRLHDCDVLLDQNYYRDQVQRYVRWVPVACRQLLGPEFALLRPEFAAARTEARFRERIERILITFGGSDPTGETFKALEALRQLSWSDVQVDVVAGASNPRLAELEALCVTWDGVHLHRHVDDMASLMASADLAASAGGTTTWERLCMGLPGISIAVADNQVELSRDLAEAGYQIFLGASDAVDVAMLTRALQHLSENPAERARMAQQGRHLVDGRGAMRVARMLVGPTLQQQH